MINEKLLQEVIQKHLPKAFIGYGQQGFMCQVHYPELCKIINDYTQQQVSVEPGVGKLDDWRNTAKELARILLSLNKENPTLDISLAELNFIQKVADN